uniref:Elongation factor 1-beta n=1 Tax=Globodera pallida TaxID=36090 RepID=A0A183BNH4_GLOPA
MAQQQAHNGVAVTSKELTEFNNCLSSRAYLHGFLPSQEDQYVFKSLTMAPSAKEYPHIARWYKHIKSYDDAERSAWPMKTGGSPQTVAAKEGTPAKKGDEDFDLFGDDGSDDEEKKRITEERLKAYAEKKSKKPGPIAKSNVIYDVKPWDDTIEIKDIEEKVRSIKCDGLIWGASKILPVAFGVQKLQICCCVEDEKVLKTWSNRSMWSPSTRFNAMVC